MAPSKFQIYMDPNISQQVPQQQHQHQQQEQPKHQPFTTITTVTTATTTSGGDVPQLGSHLMPAVAQPNNPRYVKENLEAKNQQFAFDERKLYPMNGGEFSFEELHLISWSKRQKEIALKKHCEEVERENEELRKKLEEANQQLLVLVNTLKQIQSSSSAGNTENIYTNRLSIIPQNIHQPEQGGLEYADMSCCEGEVEPNEGVSVVKDYWKNTLLADKFTVPIDQSAYIRDNVPTSTPADKSKRSTHRRMSRPSMAGSPTLKLSPITETSRDCNSKSSSSSSAVSSTPGTTKKPLIAEPIMIEPDNRPLNPNDPTTYRNLLKILAEPLDRRPNFYRTSTNLPQIECDNSFELDSTEYMVGSDRYSDPRIFSALVLSDSSTEMDMKSVCLRVDQPANEWLFYICHELHKRCQRITPDIELSIMNADPAIVYNNGSILIDEHFRSVSLDDYLSLCTQLGKTFPKSVGAYITLELIQLLRGMHKCDIIHLDINPKNIYVTGYPNREDVKCVDKRTSLIKLVGFDYAMDLRLLDADFKFNTTLDHLKTCQMIDNKPWSFEVDWYGALDAIHRMFFMEPMQPFREDGKWKIKKQFNGFPTNVWATLFEELLNIENIQSTNQMIDRAIDELSTWIQANINFLIKESANFEMMLESAK